VKLPRYTPREGYPLDQEQAQRLLRAAQGNRLECVITLAITTGMRLGEILALRWSDINMEEKVLHVRRTVDYIKTFGWVEDEPKSASGKRDIQLPQVTVDALKEHRTAQLEARLKVGAHWKEQGLVFPNRYGGFFRRMRLYAIFEKLLKEAGLPDMHFHDLRHSAATILLSMGVPAKVVQEILGHSNISTTMNIYGHVFPSMQRNAMDEMDDFFKEGK
jgi:integrase